MSLPVTKRKCISLILLFSMCLSVSSSISIVDPDLAQTTSHSFIVPIRNTENLENGFGDTRNQTLAIQNGGQESKNISNATSKGKSKIQVEEILREIFEAEFEDESLSVQQDGAEPWPIQSLAAKNETIENDNPFTNREGRAKYHENRRRWQPPQGRRRDNNRQENNRKRQALAQRNKPVESRKNAQNNRRGVQNKNNVPRPNNVNRGKGVDLTKYNAYMDAVLSRMNALIRKKRMDPLRVNLYAGPSKGQGGQNKKGNKGGPGGNNAGKIKKKGGARWEEEDSGSQMTSDEDEDGGDSGEESGEEERRSVRDFTLFKSRTFQRQMRSLENDTIEKNSDEVAEAPDSKADEGRGKVKTDKTTSVIDKKGNKGPLARLPAKKPNSPRPTRGVLHGLSTLRRDGNVQVIKDGEKARIVRSRFLLGPVALEILPKKTKKKLSREEFEDDETREIVPTPKPAMATATAPQLKGILEIRLSPGKPTRIRKLRVFPPGNIQVDGDKKTGSPGAKKAGYRKVTPMATARLRQTAIQVLRQVDNKMKTKNTKRGNVDDVTL